MLEPGTVVVTDFPGVAGVKRRPAVIVSSAEYHSHRPDVIIGLITGQTTGAIAPTDHVLQDWKLARLRLPSAFRAFLVTLPQSAITAQIGRLSERDWAAVRACVRRALASP